MLIDRINSKVKSFLNTDGLGNYSPSDFNNFLHDSIQGRYEEFFSEISRAENMENRGMIRQFIQSQADKTRQKLYHYFVSATLAFDSDVTRTKPDDLNYIDDIEDSVNGYQYEYADTQKEFNILKTGASVKYSIFMDGGSTIKIFPANSGLMLIHYLRTPNIPKWTYNSVTGLFNPSAGDFVDADVHPSEENEMVKRVLMRFGINLKEEDIVAFTISEEQREFNEENRL